MPLFRRGSDKLLLEMLKAAKPEEYREGARVTVVRAAAVAPRPPEPAYDWSAKLAELTAGGAFPDSHPEPVG